MDKKTIQYLIMGGLGLALISSFIPGMEMLAWISVLLGLAAGWSLKADVKTLLAVIVLTTFSVGLSGIPSVGSMISDLLIKIGSFFGAVFVLPALKILLKKAGIDM